MRSIGSETTWPRACRCNSRRRRRSSWGGLGAGDPAIELLSAWNLFEGESRAAFRDALAIDDATWARGRGLALSQALVALTYYLETNPAIVRWARHMIGEVPDDHARGR